MARINANQVFEKSSPVSGAESTDRGFVLDRPLDASSLDAVDSALERNYYGSEIAKRVRRAMLNFSLIDDVVIEL
jgi:hypothetical protein